MFMSCFLVILFFVIGSWLSSTVPLHLLETQSKRATLPAATATAASVKYGALKPGETLSFARIGE